MMGHSRRELVICKYKEGDFVQYRTAQGEIKGYGLIVEVTEYCVLYLWINIRQERTLIRSFDEKIVK